MKKLLFLLMLCVLISTTHAQKITRTGYNHPFLRPPNVILSSNIQTYSVKVNASLCKKADQEKLIQQFNKACEINAYDRVENNGDVEFEITLGSVVTKPLDYKVRRGGSFDSQGNPTTELTYLPFREYAVTIRLKVTEQLTGKVVFDKTVVSGYRKYHYSKTDKKPEGNDTQEMLDDVNSHAYNQATLKIDQHIQDNYDYTEKSFPDHFLTVINTKKQDYSDVREAIQMAADATKLLQPVKIQSEKFKTDMTSAVKKIEAFLTQVDPNNKKSKFNFKVTMVLYRDLIIGYMLLDRYDDAKKTLNKAKEITGEGRPPKDWDSALDGNINHFETIFLKNTQE